MRFGTKWLSITSTCSQSETAETRRHSSANDEKSADRIDGEICTPMRAA